MVTLKDAALNYKSDKKDLTTLPSVDVNTEIKEGTFEGKDGKLIKYNYMEIEGWKYSIKAEVLEKIQQTD
ncbi:MAG: hypothetical protein HC874_27360 [Richelia sp. SL_2_1]|nr:hypothetical protein [Richelia sp. SL_2_1]